MEKHTKTYIVTGIVEEVGLPAFEPIQHIGHINIKITALPQDYIITAKIKCDGSSLLFYQAEHLIKGEFVKITGEHFSKTHGVSELTHITDIEVLDDKAYRQMNLKEEI